MALKALLIGVLIGSAYPRELVTDATYLEIARYARYAGASYAETCPLPPNQATIYQTLEFSDIQSKAVIFSELASNATVLAFRGSCFPKNFDEDLNFSLVPLSLPATECPTCRVHQGFQQTYAAMSEQIRMAVVTALSRGAASDLVITGHSLGGGLAAMAGASLAASGLNPIVYTFGEPRNGNQAFTEYVDALVPAYYRVTHANDGVPKIPPKSLGYQHHGRQYWESKSSDNDASTTYDCGRTDSTDCIDGQDYGSSPINRAHLSYANVLLATVLFNPSCGYRL